MTTAHSSTHSRTLSTMARDEEEQRSQLSTEQFDQSTFEFSTAQIQEDSRSSFGGDGSGRLRDSELGQLWIGGNDASGPVSFRAPRRPTQADAASGPVPHRRGARLASPLGRPLEEDASSLPATEGDAQHARSDRTLAASVDETSVGEVLLQAEREGQGSRARRLVVPQEGDQHLQGQPPEWTDQEAMFEQRLRQERQQAYQHAAQMGRQVDHPKSGGAEQHERPDYLQLTWRRRGL